MGTAIAYNPASQLASVTRSNDSYAWSAHYNADRAYTANGLNQYSAVAGGALTYDARGNLTASAGTTYAYNGLNQLTSVSGGFAGTLAYDPANRLYQLISGASTTRFQYAGASLMAEYDGANAMLRRYVHGAGTDEPLVWYEGPGTTNRRFLQADERGSVVAVSDSAGASLAINRYDEYGIPQTGNLGRFSYTGQTALPEIGLLYYKARMYSPSLGRFMQTDPIGYGDGLNWYNYVGGDPVNATDPSGLTCLTVGGCGPVPGGIDVNGNRGEWHWYERPYQATTLDFSQVNWDTGLGENLGGAGPQIRLPTPDEIADSQAKACSDPSIQSALRNPSVQSALRDALRRTAATGREHGFEYGLAIGRGMGTTPVYEGTAEEFPLQSHFSSLVSGIYYRQIQFHTHPDPSGRGLSYGPRSDLALARSGWTVVAIRQNGEIFCRVHK